jgi:hypothetical protein
LGFDEHEPAMSKLKDIEWLFNGRHFDREIIVLCVRWYLRYRRQNDGLSLACSICTTAISNTSSLFGHAEPGFVQTFARQSSCMQVVNGR